MVAMRGVVLVEDGGESAGSLKVRRALMLLGVAYATRQDAAASEPVLVWDCDEVRGATRILETLNRATDRSLVSGCGSQRGEAWLWEELGDTSLVQFLEAARWADPDNWRRRRLSLRAAIARRRIVAGLTVWRDGRQACWLRFQQLLNRLEARAPGDGFWLGEEVTVADLALFAPLHLMQSDLTPWQAEQIAARPALAAYLVRVDVATQLGPFALQVQRPRCLSKSPRVPKLRGAPLERLYVSTMPRSSASSCERFETRGRPLPAASMTRTVSFEPAGKARASSVPGGVPVSAAGRKASAPLGMVTTTPPRSALATVTSMV